MRTQAAGRNRDTEAMTEALHGRWVHAHEEDDGGTMVFRPAGWELPPSRGRVAFELRPDGTMVEGSIAPADGLVEANGSWRTLDDRHIGFFDSAGERLQRTVEIVSAEPDRLVVRM